jgi:hypothetical protein
MTLDELDAAIAAADLALLFGADVDAGLRRRRLECHPDRFPGAADKDRAETITRMLVTLAAAAKAPPAPVTLKSRKRTYTLGRRIAVGDVADVHLATAGGEEYLLKVSRGVDGAAALDVEQDSLKAVLATANGTVFDRFVPTLCESFTIRDKPPRRINVFRPDAARLYTLEQVHARHPDLAREKGGRHLVWIFRRILMAIDLAAAADRVHGAVLPPHVLLRPSDHGAVLVGWGQSVMVGNRITSASSRYLPWYPPEVSRKQPASHGTDVSMAARCIIYLAGGDPVTSQAPPSLPGPMAEFLRACLLEAPAMRGDARSLRDSLYKVGVRLYGATEFIPLAME